MAGFWNRRRALAALIAIVVVGALAAGIASRLAAKKAEADAKARASQVTLQFGPSDLTHVELQPMARWLPLSGTLQPVHQATVKAKVSGDVRQIVVREGEAVQRGQVLGRIDTADLEAKLLERVGALESARAQLAMAEKTRSTNRALLRQSFISQNAYDNSESTYNVSLGNVKSAEAQVQLARNALRDAIVVSPLAGTVAKRHVQPGEKVAFDSPLVTVVDLRDLELQALVPAIDVPELAIGMPVELAIDGFGERRFSGRIERINPSTEPGTRAFLVYIGIGNADRTLRSGMFATGRIALAAQNALPTLPSTAVRLDAGQAYVWTIANGKLARRFVVVGRRDEESGRVEIRTELPRDVPVLASRFDNLKEGATVIVRKTSDGPRGAGAAAPQRAVKTSDGPRGAGAAEPQRAAHRSS
jgi:RND family efflux transporter MFP subunit